jgi:hypothetical protein
LHWLSRLTEYFIYTNKGGKMLTKNTLINFFHNKKKETGGASANEEGEGEGESAR